MADDDALHTVVVYAVAVLLPASVANTEGTSQHAAAAAARHALVLECATLVLPVEGGVPMVLHCVVSPAIQQPCDSCNSRNTSGQRVSEQQRQDASTSCVTCTMRARPHLPICSDDPSAPAKSKGARRERRICEQRLPQLPELCDIRLPARSRLAPTPKTAT